jgi:methionine synthase II (cobalamin-independent)
VLEARSDVVGRLLRLPELLDARERHARGELGIPELKRVQDAAVDAALPEGNALTVEDEHAKQRTIGETAPAVWG